MEDTDTDHQMNEHVDPQIETYRILSPAEVQFFKNRKLSETKNMNEFEMQNFYHTYLGRENELKNRAFLEK